MLRASACSPDMAQPRWWSISTIFSTEEDSRSGEVTRFSTPITTPWPVATPIAVDPSLIASREYSTWNRRPSGEKVLIPRSYSDLAINILSYIGRVNVVVFNRTEGEVD